MEVVCWYSLLGLVGARSPAPLGDEFGSTFLEVTDPLSITGVYHDI